MSRLAYLKLPAGDEIPLLDESAGRRPDPYCVTALEVRMDPAYSPITGVHLARAPASIFELANFGRVLQLQMIFRDPSKLAGRSESPFYFLHIPVSSILRIISRIQANATNDPDDFGDPVIAWNEWGRETHWVHGPNIRKSSSCVAGSRCVLTHFAPICPDCQEGGCACRPVCETSVLEFHPALRHINKQAKLNGQGDFLNLTGTSIHQPPGPNLFTPGRHWIDKGLDVTGMPVYPCKVARFKHEMLDELFAGQYPRILIDDEHSEFASLADILYRRILSFSDTCARMIPRLVPKALRLNIIAFIYRE